MSIDFRARCRQVLGRRATRNGPFVSAYSLDVITKRLNNLLLLNHIALHAGSDLCRLAIEIDL